MRVSDVLSTIDRSELQRLLQKSDLRAFSILLLNWFIIIICFGAVTYFSHWWVWALSAFVLAGRILGLAILMHDCAHDAFFKTKWMNRFFGKWFCAAPVLADLDRYRTYHLEHHRTAGSDADPDRPNYVAYPVNAMSFKRKVLRDLLGITGLKLTLLILKMNAGTVKYQLSYDGSKTKHVSISNQIKNLLLNLGPSLLIHLVAAYTLGHSYLLFWLSWLSFYMVFSRIRNAAEHGATINKNDLNPLLNTRTTKANYLERTCVAPNFVNYHLEHHLLPAIPSYNLSRFHKLLMHKNVLSGSKVASGYKEVIRDLISDI